ncbi:MAG: PilN domain-containing protein [Patescibacteria group bacterium]
MIRTNLLPPEQKERLKLRISYQNIISSGFILFLLILLLVIILAGFLTFLYFNYWDIENKIAIEQSKVIQTETIKGMEKKIKDLNKELVELKRIQDKRSNIYQILDNISRNLLIGVKVYTLEMDGDSKLVSVTGFSSTRENLLAIKKALEDNPNYKNIDFPLSNLANPQNINFRFSFTYEY